MNLQALLASILIGTITPILLNLVFKLVWNTKNDKLPKQENYLISYRKGGVIFPILLITIGSLAMSMILRNSSNAKFSFLNFIIILIIVFICFVIPISGLYQMYFKAIKVEVDKIYIIGLFKTTEIKRNEITKVVKKYRYKGYKDVKGSAAKTLYANNFKYVFFSKDRKLFTAERSMSHIDFFVEDLKSSGVKVI